MPEINRIYNESNLVTMARMPDNFIDCVVTSPPYFGLRDYGVEGQIGLEDTPDEYVGKMVEVFTEVRRVLKPEGTLWLNIGDSYNGSGQDSGKKIGSISQNIAGKGRLVGDAHPTKGIKIKGLKAKDLIGIPWRVAFALQSSGWWLRQDIIWAKPNPMPESVTDRCTKAHEYIFLLSKSAKYYFDNEAIKEDSVEENWQSRLTRESNKSAPTDKVDGIRTRSTFGNRNGELNGLHSGNEYFHTGKRNKRSVWSVTTKPFPEAHFATFPEDLIVDCIRAGCPTNGIVYDPFMGAGTTALVAHRLERNFIGSEINPQYCDIANKRLHPFRSQLKLPLTA